MSFRPGTSIIQRTTPPIRSAPTDSGVWFVCGLTERGQTGPQLLTSMADYLRIFGARVTYGLLYDALDTYFREGGARAYVSRVVGPGATTGTKNLLDAGAGISLVVSALGQGAFSANYKVGVVAGVGAGTYQIQVSDVNNVVLEQSPDLIDQNAAVAWGAQSQYVRIALGASALNPAVVALGALSAGNDDRASITDTQWQTALDLFSKSLGPGQVSHVGRTTSVAHIQLLNHADARNRVAICDLPDSATVATLTTITTADRAGGLGKRGAAFGPWVIVPGVVVGTTRIIPPSALVAARCAQVDAQFNPNVPAAGELGVAQYAYDVSQPAWDASTRNTLNNAGVNVIRNLYGNVRVYGWRSLVDPVAEPSWIDFGNSRLYMEIAALADVIAESYVLKEIDGQGITIQAFGGALKGMLIPFYTSGALYGATVDDAFFVDVGPTVNTPARIADNQLRAVISLRMSPMAELVTIEIVKVGTTEAVV